MKTISLKNLSELSDVAKEILDFAKGKKIFCLYGELGAGKTTLIKELCKQLGVTDKGSSPTFALVNEYHTPSQPSPKGKELHAQSYPPLGEIREGVLYHLDLYRLKSESEIYDIGYEDYLYSGNYCFIEWPEKMERLLPKDCVRVRMEVKNDERIITVQ